MLTIYGNRLLCVELLITSTYGDISIVVYFCPNIYIHTSTGLDCRNALPHVLTYRVYVVLTYIAERHSGWF